MTKYKTKPKIFIDKRGNWFQDGIKITHKWTYLTNNKNLHKDSEGTYYVDEGTGKIQVEVEDTPFVVKMIEKNDDKFYLKLNDETEEKLEFETLKFNKENIPYVKVKNNEFTARFNSAAYYELMKYVENDQDELYISEIGKKYYLS